MAFVPILADGFDNYLLKKQRWTVGTSDNVENSPAASRHAWGQGGVIPGHISGSGYAIEMPAALASDELYFEGAWNLRGTTANIVEWIGIGKHEVNSFRHFSFYLSDTRHVFARYRFGGPELGTIYGPTTGPNHVIEVGVWYWVQVYLKVHATNGSFIFKVNNETWLSASGIPTKNTGLSSTLANMFWATDVFGWPFYMDDFVWQGAGGEFQGDMIVLGKRPAAAGSENDLTVVGAATAHEATDEIAADEDTTRIQSATVGHKTSMQIAKITEVPGSSIVLGVQNVYRSRKTEPGPRSSTGIIRVGLDELAGPERFPSQSAYFTNIDPVTTVQPDTVSAWGTVAAFNALDVEVGVEVQDGAE